MFWVASSSQTHSLHLKTSCKLEVHQKCLITVNFEIGFSVIYSTYSCCEEVMYKEKMEVREATSQIRQIGSCVSRGLKASQKSKLRSSNKTAVSLVIILPAALGNTLFLLFSNVVIGFLKAQFTKILESNQKLNNIQYKKKNSQS